MKGDNESWPKIGVGPIRSSVDEKRARDIKHYAMIFGAGVWHHAQRMKPSKRWSGAYLLVIELGQLPVKRLIQEL